MRLMHNRPNYSAVALSRTHMTSGECLRCQWCGKWQIPVSRSNSLQQTSQSQSLPQISPRGASVLKPPTPTWDVAAAILRTFPRNVPTPSSSRSDSMSILQTSTRVSKPPDARQRGSYLQVPATDTLGTRSLAKALISRPSEKMIFRLPF